MESCSFLLENDVEVYGTDFQYIKTDWQIGGPNNSTSGWIVSLEEEAMIWLNKWIVLKILIWTIINTSDENIKNKKCRWTAARN